MGAMRLDLKGNNIEDVEAVRIESQGGPQSVKLVRTWGDGPPPQPCTDPRAQPSYLWVFLPRIADQHKASDDRRRGKEKAERTPEKEGKKEKRKKEKHKDKDKRRS